MKDRSFLSEFLLITNFKTVAFIIILMGIFVVMKSMEKKKVKFPIRMITATIVGLVLGIIIQWVAGFPKDPGKVTWLKEVTEWYGLFGYGFMDLLKMLVVPLVFLSIIRVIINMKGENLGKLTSRSIFMLLLTTAIAATIGIIVGSVMKLGVGASIGDISSDVEIREVTSVIDTLRGLLPSNPIKAMADGNIVAVVIFAAFIFYRVICKADPLNKFNFCFGFFICCIYRYINKYIKEKI